MSIKKTTIFRQLIYNIIIPVVIALVSIAILNFLHTYNGLKMYNDTKKNLIAEQVKGILEYQDFALAIIEKQLDDHVVEVSNQLISAYNQDPKKTITIELNYLYKKLKLEIENEDVYFINAETGIIENTTFKPDSAKNVFDFGITFKTFLESVVDSQKIISERFSMEMATGRVKKYSYISTPDKKYIIETGFYSAQADSVLELTRSRLLAIKNSSGITDIDLFIGADDPFSLLSKKILPKHSPQKSDLMRSFSSKSDMTFLVKDNNETCRHQYIFMNRQNTKLYPSAVILIKQSTTVEREMYQSEILKFISIFGITLALVIFLIFKKTKIITDPLKKLVSNVNRIRELDLNDRAEIIGNNEITRLSEHFNLMLEQLEDYYSELEDKVKQRTAEIRTKKEQIEAQQVAIMDSIHYAKRIQTSILPSDDYVKSLIENSFIFYRPKDIVSGDFYWFTKRGQYVFAAAVDCTGHGVPGAFMSIVGYNQLDYAVNIVKNDKPDEILNIMNKRVADTVRHNSGSKTIVKDGMDMTLCRFDFENMEMQCAGAYNPVYIVRNNELLEIKSDRLAVGSYYDNPDKKYKNNVFKLHTNDIIYLFSDGYADQFGGPKNRKFLKKNFRKLLLEISEKTLDEQNQSLEETIDGWRQDYHQIDDILVIGIKI